MVGYSSLMHCGWEFQWETTRVIRIQTRSINTFEWQHITIHGGFWQQLQGTNCHDNYDVRRYQFFDCVFCAQMKIILYRYANFSNHFEFNFQTVMTQVFDPLLAKLNSQLVISTPVFLKTLCFISSIFNIQWLRFCYHITALGIVRSLLMKRMHSMACLCLEEELSRFQVDIELGGFHMSGLGPMLLASESLVHFLNNVALLCCFEATFPSNAPCARRGTRSIISVRWS